MNADVLLLGSQSESRKILLTEAKIPFKTISHNSSEEEIAFNGDLDAYVLAIAQEKMNSLILPTITEIDGKYIYVLTADSMVMHMATGKLLGKPKDELDAIRMLALSRESKMIVATGCCLRRYKKAAAEVASCVYEEKKWVTSAIAEFVVPEDEIDFYLRTVPLAMYSAGAGILEKFGLNYLKTIDGSFSSAQGLPLYELRIALKEMGFVFCL